MVTAGQTRDFSLGWGPWAEKLAARADGENAGWKARTLPAWIELEFARPVTVREIHLTFDSGLRRELILTPSDTITRKVVGGRSRSWFQIAT